MMDVNCYWLLGSLLASPKATVYTRGAHRILVEWDPVPDGTITGYRIRYVDLKNHKLASTTTTGAAFVLIDNLLPYTPYGISVTSFSDQGEGASSPEVVAITYESGNTCRTLSQKKIKLHSLLKYSKHHFSAHVLHSLYPILDCR